MMCLLKLCSDITVFKAAKGICPTGMEMQKSVHIMFLTTVFDEKFWHNEIVDASSVTFTNSSSIIDFKKVTTIVSVTFICKKDYIQIE